MNDVENKVVRIGLDGTRSLNSALLTFMRWFNNKQQQQKERDLNVKTDKAITKDTSKEYTDMDKFYYDQYKQGNTRFLHNTISTQSELNKFSQLAKDYGISYYIEKRPFDLAELIQKEQNKLSLTSQEKDRLDCWTEFKDGTRVISNDIYQLTFAAKDGVKIESLVKDLTKWEQNNLEKRCDNAKEIHKEREHDMNLDKVKIPEPERGV